MVAIRFPSEFSISVFSSFFHRGCIWTMVLVEKWAPWHRNTKRNDAVSLLFYEKLFLKNNVRLQWAPICSSLFTLLWNRPKLEIKLWKNIRLLRYEALTPVVVSSRSKRRLLFLVPRSRSEQVQKRPKLLLKVLKKTGQAVYRTGTRLIW